MTSLLSSAPLCLRGTDLFPLAPGNHWIYRNNKSGACLEVRVIGMASVNRRMYYVVRGFAAQVEMMRIDESGNLVYWSESSREEKIVLAFREESGAPFESHGRDGVPLGQWHAERRPYEGPAGRWTAVECNYRAHSLADGGELRELYAENIGLVRRVVRTATGPQTYDLVYAQVGRQVVTAGEVGRLNVWVLSGADGRSWDATVTVGPFGNAGLKLNFSTEQQYDMRLRDARANVVWTWSDGKTFERNPQVASVGGWTATVRVPHPANPGESDHYYTLEAWLTTGEGEPRFAAATTVSLAKV